jgi:large subunit ribosomal protein L21
MYAVIEAGGRQYKVQQGDEIEVDFFDHPVGTRINFTDVLMLGGDAGSRIGKPYLDGVSVEGEIVGQRRGDKVLIFKKRRRHANSQSLRGFRSHLTALKITSITP